MSGAGAPKPTVTAGDTVDEIVLASKRKGKHFRLRLEFVQRRTQGGKACPGPLAALVRAGDLRALNQYLLLVTKASAPPWDAALPAAVWARALGDELPETKSARSAVSKAWLRLERLHLVRRERRKRMAAVYLLRDDGSGGTYTSPGEAGDRYFQVPLALWLQGPDGGARWYEVLALAEVAVLLIARSLGDGFLLPQEQGPAWYGISADTVNRGLTGLQSKGLLSSQQSYVKAPLSASGYRAEYRYTLRPPFGPVGRLSGHRAKKTAKKGLSAAAPTAATSGRGGSRRRAPNT